MSFHAQAVQKPDMLHGCDDQERKAYHDQSNADMKWLPDGHACSDGKGYLQVLEKLYNREPAPDLRCPSLREEPVTFSGRRCRPYCRAIIVRISASLSLMSSPPTSTFTLKSFPVNR